MLLTLCRHAQFRLRLGVNSHVKACNKITLPSQVIIEQSSKEAGVTKALVQEEEKSANIMKEEATAMQIDCQKDLDEALPALDAAVSALKSLSKGDIVEVGVFFQFASSDFMKLGREYQCFTCDEACVNIAPHQFTA